MTEDPLTTVVMGTGKILDEPAILKALGGRKVQFVSNPGWELGLAGSLRAGIAAFGDS